MSTRWYKKARALAFHVEYGGYYPAMRRSGVKLKALGLTEKQLRRAQALSLKKVHKILARDRT